MLEKLKGYKTYILATLAVLASSFSLIGLPDAATKVADFSGKADTSLTAWESTATILLDDIATTAPELKAQAEELIKVTGKVALDAGAVIQESKEQVWPRLIALIAAIGTFFTRLHTRAYSGV